MKFIKILFLSLILTGCSNTSNTSNETTAADTASGVGIVISAVDVNRVPLKTVNVTITSKSSSLATGALAAQGSELKATTNANGQLIINTLNPGKYAATFDTGNGQPPATTTFEFSNSNVSNENEEASVILPLSQDTYGNLTKVDAIVASLSGHIGSSPSSISLSDATATLSSNKLGTIASGSSDTNGNYSLIVNISKQNAGALNDLTLTFSKKGFKEHRITGLQVEPNTNLASFDIDLTEQTDAENQDEQNLIIAIFDFSSVAGWNTNGSLWHQHTNTLAIQNAAVPNGVVKLSPDDQSAGFLPDPVTSGSSMWFGTATTGLDETGNFLDFSDTYSNFQDSFSGGTSASPSVAGVLTSPAIDLTGVAPGTDISLTFDTWWEIESVNPNATGFDLMTVQYSIDNGLTWVNLARLNPLTDPVTGPNITRDPIPYSNNGFNAAPSWVEQERIPLVDPSTGTSLAGQTIKLQFSFDTVDSLFNGFRGWIIDNVEVAQVTGTYPVMDQYSLYVNGQQNFNWDAMFLSWDIQTGDVAISPSIWDSATTSLTTLPSGFTTTITGTFDYQTSTATKAQLAFSFDGGPITPITTSLVTFPAISGTGLNVSGDVTPVLGNTFVDIWIQMLDATNNVVSENPVAYYPVQ